MNCQLKADFCSAPDTTTSGKRNALRKPSCISIKACGIPNSITPWDAVSIRKAGTSSKGMRKESTMMESSTMRLKRKNFSRRKRMAYGSQSTVKTKADLMEKSTMNSSISISFTSFLNHFEKFLDFVVRHLLLAHEEGEERRGGPTEEIVLHILHHSPRVFVLRQKWAIDEQTGAIARLFRCQESLIDENLHKGGNGGISGFGLFVMLNDFRHGALPCWHRPKCVHHLHLAACQCVLFHN